MVALAPSVHQCPHSFSIFLQILECVTANLTLVYAIQAYFMLKKKRNTSVMVRVTSLHRTLPKGHP